MDMLCRRGLRLFPRNDGEIAFAWESCYSNQAVPASSLPRIARERSAEHLQHFVPDEIARAASPCRRERQPVHVGRRERNVSNAARRHSRRPSRDDGNAKPGSDEIDDGLLFIGELDDARMQSGLGKQLHGEIVTMRTRTALGYDQRLLGEIGNGNAFSRCERMTIGDGDDRGLVQEKQEFKPLVRFFRRTHQGNVEPA